MNKKVKKMKTVTIALYKFDELSDDAKETAREAYRYSGIEYFWFDDAIGSIKAFCDYFNVKIKDYEIGAYSPSYLTTDANNANFRGIKLKSIDRENMPTGYCLDCTLWQTFYDQFKRTGDALYAFNDAIDDAVREIVRDAEYQYSDESIDEMLTINEYDFTENGKIY